VVSVLRRNALRSASLIAPYELLTIGFQQQFLIVRKIRVTLR